MKRKNIVWILVVTCLLLLSFFFRVKGQYCTTPGCQHFMPTRTPPRIMVYLPYVQVGRK